MLRMKGRGAYRYMHVVLVGKHTRAGMPVERQRVCRQGSAMGVSMFRGPCSPH